MNQIVPSYLDFLNEEFGFANKVFKANVLKKIGTDVKNTIKNKRVDKVALDKALKKIPVIDQDRIKKFLARSVPNFEHNQMLAKNHFAKKYPDRENNDIAATATAIVNASSDSKSIKNSIRDVDRLYSRGGNGGGPFVLMLLGLFIVMGVFIFEDMEFKTKAMSLSLGALLIIASVKSL